MSLVTITSDFVNSKCLLLKSNRELYLVEYYYCVLVEFAKEITAMP